MSGFTLVPAVKTNLIALLGSLAGSAFTVEGFQRQSHDAAEFAISPHVTVYWRQTDFNRERSGWLQGPFRASMTFAVEIKIAAPAGVDLRVLNSPSATAQELMSALAAAESAALRADRLFDDLAGTIWAILIDPRNYALGGASCQAPALPALAIADRWVASARKELPLHQGEFVILSGALDYTCTGTETTAGDAGVPAGVNAIDTTITETTDPAGAAGDGALAGAKAGGQ